MTDPADLDHEAPEADAAEQALDADPADEDFDVDDRPDDGLEVPEWDAQEQAQAVAYEDEYR